MKRRLWICILLILAAVCPSDARLQMLFEPLGTGSGLAADYVVSILQLADNRIMAVTLDDVNIWNGHSFQQIRKSRDEFTPLPGYQGGYHAYIDKKGEVWIKDYGRLWHYDKQWKRVTQPLPPECDDVFIDDDGNVYFIKQDPDNPMLDLKVVKGNRYQFYANGSMRCFAADNGRLLYETLLPMSDSVAASSLVVTDRQRGKFYQLLDQRFCMMFDLTNRQWSEIFRSERLHTITLTDPNTALITSYGGIWKINLTDMKAEYISQIKLTDGNYVSSSRLNTVFRDREGTLWLGSYDRGLLKGCRQPVPMFPVFWMAGGVVLIIIALSVFHYVSLERQRRILRSAVPMECDDGTESMLRRTETVSNRPEKVRKNKDRLPVKHDELIAKARAFIQSNMANPDYTVEKLAQDLCMDRTGLYKKMKATTHQSPLEFIRSIRLEHAANLMKEGKHSMAEIASLSGMGSVRHMMQCFKTRNKKPAVADAGDTVMGQTCRNVEINK